MVYIPDFAARVLTCLPIQDREGATFQAAAAAFGEGLQTQEDRTNAMLSYLDLPTSTGPGLDVWGRVLGEQRGGLTDSEYRRFLQAKMRILRAQSTPDELISLFVLMVQGVGAWYSGLLPAAYQVQAVVDRFPGAHVRARTRRNMELLRPAGVEGAHILAPSGYFGFAGNPLALGFGAGRLAAVL